MPLINPDSEIEIEEDGDFTVTLEMRFPEPDNTDD